MPWSSSPARRYVQQSSGARQQPLTSSFSQTEVGLVRSGRRKVRRRDCQDGSRKSSESHRGRGPEGSPAWTSSPGRAARVPRVHRPPGNGKQGPWTGGWHTAETSTESSTTSAEANQLRCSVARWPGLDNSARPSLVCEMDHGAPSCGLARCCVAIALPPLRARRA
jgi:hypothetical protein